MREERGREEYAPHSIEVVSRVEEGKRSGVGGNCRDP